MKLPVRGAVQELAQRRMSHLQALAWMAREALPPRKLPLLLLYHCLSALRLCSEPCFSVQRGMVEVPHTLEEQSREAQHLLWGPQSHAFLLCVLLAVRGLASGLWISLRLPCFM